MFLISSGIMLCTYASGKHVPQESSMYDWIMGIALLSTSLVLGARMGIYQEQIYAKFGRHHREALFFSVIEFLYIFFDSKMAKN